MCVRGATQLWSIDAYGDYGGGMAIVAANTWQEAKKLAGEIPAGAWNIKWAKGCSEKLKGAFFNGAPRVITHYEMGE